METQIISHLSGVLTPDMIDSIQQPTILYAVGGLIVVAVVAICMIWFIGAIINCFRPTKSQEYRSLLSDMYVVGMVKKFAREDDIDLVKELKEFAKIERKKKLSDKAIDQVISDNLKEKVDAKSEKEIDKIEGQF